MRAFIAHSFAHTAQQQAVLHELFAVLDAYGIQGFSFVLSYPAYPKGSEKEMMQDALKELSSSDLLIAEVSNKEVGVGLEVGYAKAKGIPIVYLRHEESEYSKTVGGVADDQLVYKGGDLSELLAPVIEKWT